MHLEVALRRKFGSGVAAAGHEIHPDEPTRAIWLVDDEIQSYDAELLQIHYHVARAKLPPGRYRRVTGSAVHELQAEGRAVSHLYLRYLNPLPANLGESMMRFQHVLVAETNLGQLKMLLQDSKREIGIWLRDWLLIAIPLLRQHLRFLLDPRARTGDRHGLADGVSDRRVFLSPPVTPDMRSC